MATPKPKDAAIGIGAGFLGGGGGSLDLGSDAGDTTLGAVTNTIGGLPQKGLSTKDIMLYAALGLVGFVIIKKVM